jgi:hypothetical protein
LMPGHCNTCLRYPERSLLDWFLMQFEV